VSLNIGVLLLYCKDGRLTTFTQAWADLAMQQVSAYLFHQSGGRERMTYQVFDWLPLDMYEVDWSALGIGAYNTLKPSLEQALHTNLDQFSHILIGIDTPNSSGGTTPGAFTYLAARNFSPSFIAHELGHRYGADDAYRETDTGPKVYQNQFCVMGAMGWPATFADPVLTDPNAPMLDQSGPNMSAPTLIGTGWLAEGGHGLATEISQNSLLATGGSYVELSVLDGAPGPGWARPPLVARYQDLLIEYRIGDPNGWDRGLPNPGGGAVGWVIAHRSPKGTPVATFVNAVGAKPGNMLVFGKDDPLDIFNSGPLKLAVLSVNPEARTVRFHLTIRAARQPPSGRVFGGVKVGGGGLVWTPGRGVNPVPPHSPLVNVLDAIARVHALQETMAAASINELVALREETSLAIQSLQQTVSELSPEPVIPPLEQAFNDANELGNLFTRFEDAASYIDLPEGLMENSRERLTRIQEILAETIRSQQT